MNYCEILIDLEEDTLEAQLKGKRLCIVVDVTPRMVDVIRIVVSFVVTNEVQSKATVQQSLMDVEFIKNLI